MLATRSEKLATRSENRIGRCPSTDVSIRRTHHPGRQEPGRKRDENVLGSSTMQERVCSWLSDPLMYMDMLGHSHLVSLGRTVRNGTW